MYLRELTAEAAKKLLISHCNTRKEHIRLNNRDGYVVSSEHSATYKGGRQCEDVV